MQRPRLAAIYIYLAVASGFLGVMILFGILAACQWLGIDITSHWWILVIPPVLAITLNVCLIELWGWLRK